MSEAKQLSRRGLLSMAAAGAGTFMIAGTASALAETPSNDKPLRWGIIGTGTRGAYTHIPTLKEVEARGHDLIALCDVVEERLHSAAGKVGHAVQTYSDYQKLLANPDINAVVIAVPNLLHREVLAATVQAGKHVLCEKPAGATPEDATAMGQTAASSKNVVMFGMQYRNGARAKKIGELIAAGEVGKPKYLVQNCSRGDWNLSPEVWRYADPKRGGQLVNWRFAHAASGGTLNEFSCHYLDLLHWYAGGLPTSISCDGGISVYHDGRDTWDRATVTLKYSDDLTAVHTLSMFGPSRADMTVMGDEGSIESVGDAFRVIRRPKPGEKGGNRIRKIETNEPPSHGVDEAVVVLYDDFLNCVQTGKKPDASPARALAASRTCWLAELASDRKAEVKWNEMVASGA